LGDNRDSLSLLGEADINVQVCEVRNYSVWFHHFVAAHQGAFVRLMDNPFYKATRLTSSGEVIGGWYKSTVGVATQKHLACGLVMPNHKSRSCSLDIRKSTVSEENKLRV
jgi:hypothetical protein